MPDPKAKRLPHSVRNAMRAARTNTPMCWMAAARAAGNPWRGHRAPGSRAGRRLLIESMREAAAHYGTTPAERFRLFTGPTTAWSSAAFGSRRITRHVTRRSCGCFQHAAIGVTR